MIKNAFKKLIYINDSPHRIAGGFSLGVFLGVLPGVGPLASVAISMLLRFNHAAALAGSLLTNFWFSIVVFALAVKVGAAVTGSDWQIIYDQCKQLMDDFYWKKLFDSSIWIILKPVLIGYAVVGLLAAIFAYGVAWGLIVYYRRRRNKAPVA